MCVDGRAVPSGRRCPEATAVWQRAPTHARRTRRPRRARVHARRRPLGVSVRGAFPWPQVHVRRRTGEDTAATVRFLPVTRLLSGAVARGRRRRRSAAGGRTASDLPVRCDPCVVVHRSTSCLVEMVARSPVGPCPTALVAGGPPPKGPLTCDLDAVELVGEVLVLCRGGVQGGRAADFCPPSRPQVRPQLVLGRHRLRTGLWTEYVDTPCAVHPSGRTCSLGFSAGPSV